MVAILDTDILNVTNSKEILEVPDPYYGGTNGFEIVFQMLDKSCMHIADKLNNNE